MTTNLKCVKRKCKYYFTSDNYYISCQIAKEYILNGNGNCIGVRYSNKLAEDMACKISKMVSEYNSLKQLPEFIKNNQ